MKKTGLVLFLCFLVSCATSHTNTSSTNNDTVTDLSPQDTAVTDQADNIETYDDIIRKYRKEGFISPDAYTILIVKPSDTSESEEDITRQARRRTLTSFQKYIRQQGKTVDSNTNAALLNLINEYGSMKKASNTEKTRVVYLFTVKRERLKRYLDSI